VAVSDAGALQLDSRLHGRKAEACDFLRTALEMPRLRVTGSNRKL
jgi:hypothetical protein